MIFIQNLKTTRLCELVVKQCTTLWAVWSLTEPFSLMNFLTSASLSPHFLCTWFQDALFWVSSLGSCASILAMWDTVYMWGSAQSFIEIDPSGQKLPLIFLYWNINCKVTQQCNLLVVVIFKAYANDTGDLGCLSSEHYEALAIKLFVVNA